MSFKVFVDDNFHFMDESERYERGEYESYESAEAACKAIVNEYLTHTYKDGMSADDLYDSYVSFGEDPFIVPAPEESKFSAWVYAKQRCPEICNETR